MVGEKNAIGTLVSDQIHSFVEICNTTKSTKNIPEECFLMLEVPHEGIFLNFILQNFAGQIISELQGKYRKFPREIKIKAYFFLLQSGLMTSVMTSKRFISSHGYSQRVQKRN